MGTESTDVVTPADNHTDRKMSNETREDATFMREAALHLEDTSPSEQMTRLQYTAVAVGGLVITIGLALALTWLLRG